MKKKSAQPPPPSPSTADVSQPPRALFDVLDTIDSPLHPCVLAYLDTLPVARATCQQDAQMAQAFLASYAQSPDTYLAYRREVERFLQWAWRLAKSGLKLITAAEVRAYLRFVQAPPLQWIGTAIVPRFIATPDGAGKQHHPDWRPFVVRVAKAEAVLGKAADATDYSHTQGAMRAVFAGLSTFFSFLQQEGYVKVNPVQLIRQKNQYLQKISHGRVTRKLSLVQWRFVVETMQAQALRDSTYERHVFLLSLFYLLGLRISEVSETPGRIPCMGDFAPDKHGHWWFTTVGKGNKRRDVAVPDAMLAALRRYRQHCQLSPLPRRGETTPLVHKQRGRGGLGPRQVRNLVQTCFDQAMQALRQHQRLDDAEDLAAATVHWLRHTAISADIERRPREHVRDDAGHESALVTDRYIDIDRLARHASARHKPLLSPYSPSDIDTSDPQEETDGAPPQ